MNRIVAGNFGDGNATRGHLTESRTAWGTSISLLDPPYADVPTNPLRPCPRR
jgi:hypothetical protein